MKKFLVLAIAMVLWAGQSWALEFTFSDKDFLNGASWGTMELTAVGSSTLMVQYTASTAPPIPVNSEATGFAFAFAAGVLDSVTNPTNDAFDGDRDDLTWIKYAGDLSLPQPSNGDEFTPNVDKTMFFFGVTEDNNNNFTPPGIKPGDFDVFFLQFTGLELNLMEFDLAQFVTLTGVRLQSLPDDINEGSLFLVGKPGGGTDEQELIPEPSTIILLGAGLVGLGFWYRRKKA